MYETSVRMYELNLFAKQAFDNCVADFTFEASFGGGDAGLTGKLLFSLGDSKRTFPREG